MISISLLSETEIGEVNKFYQDEYQKPRSEAKFNWEFSQAPGGKAIYVIARDKAQDGIVGTMCAMPFMLEDEKGRKVMSGKVEDLLIDKAYRGKRLYEQMFEFLESQAVAAGYRYLWAFTYATKSFARVGFKVPYSSDLGFFICRFYPAAKQLLASRKRSIAGTLIGFGLPVLSKLRQLQGAFKRKSLAGYSISNESTRDLTTLLRNVNSAAAGFHISQNEEFIKWRILENPYVQFEHFSLKDPGGNLRGNIICSISEDGIGQVVQALFDSAIHEEARLALIQNMVSSMKKKCDMIKYWGFPHRADGRSAMVSLKAAGFIFTGRGIPFVWKAIQPEDNVSPYDLSLSRMGSQGTV